VIWLLLFPIRFLAAIAVYALGVVCCLTIVGIPVGLACFSLVRDLARIR
jgi:uncharacterized membrane protein YccF (DUF307 family)